MTTELQIIDGVLQNCTTDKNTVTIPSEVEMVSRRAFDSCPDVHIINLHRQYITKELSDSLYRVFKDVIVGWDDDLYTPCFPVYNIPSEINDNAIEKVVHKTQTKYPDKKIKIITLTPEQISKMIKAQAKEYDIVLPYSMSIWNETNEGDEYGILYIKDITADNYLLLGNNFDYNLIKYYSFLGTRISSRWLTVIGTSVSLEPSDVCSAFSKSCCWMKNPSEYLNYMNDLGLVVG